MRATHFCMTMMMVTCLTTGTIFYFRIALYYMCYHGHQYLQFLPLFHHYCLGIFYSIIHFVLFDYQITWCLLCCKAQEDYVKCNVLIVYITPRGDIEWSWGEPYKPDALGSKLCTLTLGAIGLGGFLLHCLKCTCRNSLPRAYATQDQPKLFLDIQCQ